MTTTPGYSHTQSGKLHWLMLLLGGASMIGSLMLPDLLREYQAHTMPGWSRMPNVVAVLLLVCGAICLLVAAAFARLRVSDTGERLLVQFGPLPLLWRSIRYADITSVERSRTRLVDGWGVHYVPGRGTTYNISGFECVKIAIGRRVLRIGTDDAEGLLAFLQMRLGERSGEATEAQTPAPNGDAEPSTAEASIDDGIPPGDMHATGDNAAASSDVSHQSRSDG